MLNFGFNSSVLNLSELVLDLLELAPNDSVNLSLLSPYVLEVNIS